MTIKQLSSSSIRLFSLSLSLSLSLILMWTRRKLSLCGFLDMSVFGKMGLLTELLKKLLTKQPTDNIMPFSNLNIWLPNIYHVWQKEWDKTALLPSKFHGIIPNLAYKLLSFCGAHKEDTILNRLRLGHSNVAHSFILKEKWALFVLHVILLPQSNISWLNVLI